MSERDRAKIKTQNKTLYDDVSRLLFAHDPIGINFETNTGEYEPEVDAIVPQLGSCASAADVRCVLHAVFVRFFDAKTAGPEVRYEALAQELWHLWRCRHSRSQA